MKRLFTTLLVCVLALPMCAQVVKAKKVAILEVVDREGSINYGVKLQLRSSLTSAITQTAGYEGYDRVDMAAIFGEHDFQRTGVVSDDQIKKLGEMSGCDYVLIAEAATIDANNLILVAKIVNVTTGRVEANTDTMIAINANSIRNGGMELAKRLLVAEKPTSQNDSNAYYGAPQNQINNNVSTEQTRPTTSTSDLGPRSKKTRLMVEAGVYPFVLGTSWGWQLKPNWFVGCYGYVGSVLRYSSEVEDLLLGGFIVGITTKAHLSKKKKSMYLGGKLGIGAGFGDDPLPLIGIELGYDFGKLSAGVCVHRTEVSTEYYYEAVGFIGPVVCYNF